MNQCIQPGSIQDWELDAYADGMPIDRIGQHLRQCSYCADRLRHLRQSDHRLGAVLFRLNCPSADEIRALRWNQLSPTRAALVRQHLATCTICAHDAATYDGPPAGKSKEEAGWLERAISVLVARLSPLTLAPRPALRGETAMDMIYEVQEMGWEITLTSLMETRGYSLAGQILGPATAELARTRVTLLADNHLVQEVEPDATGWFEFHGLATGEYDLWLEFVDAHVEMPQIRLGASSLSDD